MNRKIKNLFITESEKYPDFNFWYLLRSGPKHAPLLHKILSYPFFFFIVIFPLFNIIYDSYWRYNRGYDFNFFMLLISLFSISIGLGFWIALARQDQKRHISNRHSLMFPDIRSLLINSNWSYLSITDKMFIKQIAHLKGHGFNVVKVTGLFIYKKTNSTIYVGDIFGRQLNSNSLGKETSFVMIKSDTNTNSNEILNSQQGIHDSFKKNTNIDISPLIDYKLSLTLKENYTLLEFDNLINSPIKKIELGSLFLNEGAI